MKLKRSNLLPNHIDNQGNRYFATQPYLQENTFIFGHMQIDYDTGYYDTGYCFYLSNQGPTHLWPEDIDLFNQLDDCYHLQYHGFFKACEFEL